MNAILNLRLDGGSRYIWAKGLDLNDQVSARDYVDFGIFTYKVTNGPNGTNVTTWDIDISERSDYPNSRECTFQKFWQLTVQ